MTHGETNVKIDDISLYENPNYMPTRALKSTIHQAPGAVHLEVQRPGCKAGNSFPFITGSGARVVQSV
jgi:hypothetical protein